MENILHYSTRKLQILIVAVLILTVAMPAILSKVYAGQLTNSYVRMSRMKTGQGTDLRIVFKTSATNGTENKFRLTVTSGFTVNTTQTVSSAGCATETGATALPGTLSAAGDNSAKTITISGTSDLAVSTSYCVDLTSTTALTNPAAGGYNGTLDTLTSASAVIDTRDVGLRIVTDDQIVVTAVVPPIFNFALSGYTDTFSTTLDPTAVVSTSGRTATVTTNASKGWIAWVKDSNQGLSSASAPYNIATSGSPNDATPATLTAGTEGYVLDVDLTTDATGGGTVTLAGEYNGTTTAAGGALNATFLPIASANGTASGDVLTLIERAAIAGNTPAGTDYTDTLTVVAAGNF